MAAEKYSLEKKSYELTKDGGVYNGKMVSSVKW